MEFYAFLQFPLTFVYCVILLPFIRILCILLIIKSNYSSIVKVMHAKEVIFLKTANFFSVYNKDKIVLENKRGLQENNYVNLYFNLLDILTIIVSVIMNVILKIGRIFLNILCYVIKYMLLKIF